MLDEVSYVGVLAGSFDMMVEVYVQDDEHLFRFLSDDLSRIEGIEATETWAVLHTMKYNYAWSNPIVPVEASKATTVGDDGVARQTCQTASTAMTWPGGEGVRLTIGGDEQGPGFGWMGLTKVSPSSCRRASSSVRGSRTVSATRRRLLGTSAAGRHRPRRARAPASSSHSSTDLRAMPVWTPRSSRTSRPTHVRPRSTRRPPPGRSTARISSIAVGGGSALDSGKGAAAVISARRHDLRLRGSRQGSGADRCR